MPIAYYLIPIVEGPYSRENPQRPKYVSVIRCNWVGQCLPLLKNHYLCKVNTTETKHAALQAEIGVRLLPRYPLLTLVGNLPAGAIQQIHAALTWLALPYYADETLRHLIQRIVVSGLFGLPNVGRDTLLRDLPLAVRQRGGALLDKWNIPYTGNDTVLEVLQHCRDIFWNPDHQFVEQF